MKFGALIIVLLLVPKPAMSQEGTGSDVELRALLDRSAVAGYRNLHSEITHHDLPEPGVISQWRERMFSTIVVAYQRRDQQDLMDDYRLRSVSALNERTNESRMVSMAVLKETLRFAQERLPEVERLIKVLRFEVSTDMISETEQERGPVEAEPVKKPDVRGIGAEERLFVKTGLRIPVAGGKLNLLSETEARIGNISSYLKIYLNGRNDSRLGVRYAFSRDVQVQVERQVNHGADADVNMVQLVCVF
jgi:hypothetical protein